MFDLNMGIIKMSIDKCLSLARLGGCSDFDTTQCLLGNECSVGAECEDNVSCTTDSCVSGVCTYDNLGCDCVTLDVNGDANVDVMDLSAIVLAFLDQDLGSDVNGDGQINILDLIYFNTRVAETACG